jgi:CBS domain-containing protein
VDFGAVLKLPYGFEPYLCRKRLLGGDWRRPFVRKCCTMRYLAPLAADRMAAAHIRRETMQLKDMMSRDVEVIRPGATIQEAARRMQARNIGSLIVADGDHFQGILTDRDITLRVAAEGRDPTSTRVREAMTPEILWCFDDADLTTAVHFMNERQIRHLAVLDRNRQLVGIVSLYALAMHTGDQTLAGTAIRWPA